jgi:sigma-B regulation protein RsbU (phosphoserine phosphatase)
MDDELKKLQDENTRLKSAMRELAVLNDISGVINSTMTVEEISQRIMKKVAAAVKAGEAAVHTFSDSDSQLSPKTFVRDSQTKATIAKAKLDVRIAGWIAHHKKPLVINDIKSDERFKGIDLTDNPLVSLLAVPLSAKGKLIGTLTVFNSRKPSGFGDDDIRLLGIIGVQAAQIIENARLYQEELRLRQLEGEVRAAQKIQEGFLPDTNPDFGGWDIIGASRPAKETGGDYYDFIQTSGKRLYFTLGDVSGKGLPAALLMSTIQGQARLLVNRNPETSPYDILHELNLITCQLSGSSQFATMVIGVIGEGGNEICISNGGHNYPIVIRVNGAFEEITESSVLIGMFDQAEFSDTVCQLEDGDLLAIASDGIEEAFDQKGQEFGLDRFRAILIENRHLAAEEIHRTIVQEVDKFRGQAEQSDDITLVIIKKKVSV